MKKLLLGLSMAVLGGLAFNANADYYLIGSFNDWTQADPNAHFTAGSNTDEYVLDYQGTLISGFKINDGSWSNAEANFGGSSTLTIGEVYTLQVGSSSGNITLSENIENPHIVLNVSNPAAPTLLITGQSVEIPIPDLLYIRGDLTGWDANPEYVVNRVGDSKIFTGKVTMAANQASFKIADAGWAIYNYGGGEMEVYSNLPGVQTLVSGSQSNITVTNWEGGEMELTFDLESLKLTVVGNDQPAKEGIEPAPEVTLYVVGADVDGIEWTLETNPMTYDASTGLYTWTGNTLASKFKINDGSWNGEYNLGSSQENKVDLVLGQAYNLQNGDSGDILFANCASVSNPTVIVDLDALTVTVTGDPVGEPLPPVVPDEPGAAPAQLYLIGNIPAWGENEGKEMSLCEPGIYYIENVELSDSGNGNSYFAFTSQLGSWDLINANRIGPEEGDAPFSPTTGNAFFKNSNAWLIAPGTYSFYVNFNTDMAATDAALGIKAVGVNANGEEVIYNLQGVRVNRNNMAPGIYIINGKKMVIK
ncbi:MAG: hypothetical protein J1F16_09380 [Muribaculaceae bacterium]|nr:hypothetical protein [Muribaculaceae bacterium]